MLSPIFKMLSKNINVNFIRYIIFSVSVAIVFFSCAHRHKPITFQYEFERNAIEQKWGYPLKKTVFEINSYFGDVRRSGTKTYSHQGIDIKANKNEPVYAVQDGIVTFAGKMGNYGKLVIISHLNGWETRYAHLNSILVKPHQRLRRGEIIGKVGSTGNATNYHLHFELRQNNIPKNPLLIIPLPH